MRCVAVLVMLGLAIGGCAAAVVPAGLHVRATWGGDDGAERWTTSEVRAIAFSRDGRYAVLIDDRAKLVAIPTGKVLATVPYQYVGWGPIAFAPDGKHFAVVDAKRGCVGVWSVDPARETACLPADDTAAAAFSPNGQAIAVGAKDHVTRWSVDGAKRGWSTEIPKHDNLWAAFAWVAPDLILCDGGALPSLARLDATDGHVAWNVPMEMTRLLGADGGAAVVHTREALVRVSLATGARIGEQPVVFGDAVELLASGEVLVQDFLGVVHRYGRDGGEAGSFLVPRETKLVARADGRFGLLLARDGVQTIDPRTGTPLDLADQQTAAIRSIDASATSIISVGEDGSVVERRPDGALVKRMHATARHCLATAVSAAAREAVCAADIQSVEGLAGREPPTHEWVSLADGKARAIDWFAGGAVALDARATWVGTQTFAMFVEARDRTPLPGKVLRWTPPTTSITQRVAVARIVEGGQAAIFGGLGFDASFESHQGVGWYPGGLWRMARGGAVEALEEKALVFALGANHAEDAVAVGLIGGVALWRRDGAAWRRAWTQDEAPSFRGYASPEADVVAVAVTDDVSLVAAAVQSGAVVMLLDGASGHVLEEVPATGQIAALAFGPDHRLYAGTLDGRVIVYSARKP